MSDIKKNPFDFSDTSNLPEDIQKALEGDTAEKVQAVVDLLGYSEEPVGIKQILAAYINMYNERPNETTLRSYLNRAADNGKIVKPTRLTYLHKKFFIEDGEPTANTGPVQGEFDFE